MSKLSGHGEMILNEVIDNEFESYFSNYYNYQLILQIYTLGINPW